MSSFYLISHPIRNYSIISSRVTKHLVGGFADSNKPLLNHFLSACVKVVGEEVKRERLELRVENVNNAVGEDNVPKQQREQSSDCRAFPV